VSRNQPTIEQLSLALENLANAINASTPSEATYLEIWGWNLPAINSAEFAAYVRAPVKRLHSLTDKEVSNEDLAALQKFAVRAQIVQTNSVPQLPGGGAFHVYLTVRSLVDSINETITKYTDEADWQKIESDKLLPRLQVRRLKSIENKIDKLSASSDDVEAKLNRINDADAAAKELPETLESLGEARDAFVEAKAEIDANRGSIENKLKESDEALKEIQAAQARAAELVELTEQARAAAVTQGLGAAFAGRAATLQVTTAVLGVFLALTLLLGWYVSSNRIAAIHALMGNPAASVKLLWVNFALVLTSVGAPVWFAWLLTKQIGQRFRLAEDYAFKATVAKAYEGYRKEAARHNDPDLEKKLFTLALTRLEEPPLRLIEKATPGTPLQDIAGPFLSRRAREGNEGE
jgi:hypothetical protein